MEILQTTESVVSIPKQDVIKNKAEPQRTIQSQKIHTGFRRKLLSFLIRMRVLWLVLKNFKNPRNSLKVFKELLELKSKILGGRRFKKIASVDGRHFWDLYTPGWNSKTFDNFIEGEINRIATLKRETNRFTNVFVAITKKCALKCEHCFEWDVLNEKERLSLNNLKTIVKRLQKKGVGQIQFSGGEPLQRINDIISLLKEAKSATDFWVITSGHNLSFKNAKRLKEAGLTGIEVSLDHYNKEKHNTFRGHQKSFDWAKQAVLNAIENRLVTGISICVTKPFVTEEHLLAYMELAKDWGVSFVQILEPKAVGHYQGKDVVLQKEHIDILEEFYLKMNYDKKYANFPILTYHGYHHRRIGCFSSANRNLYVDTDGDMHACPFCRTKRGSVLASDFDGSLDKLTTFGCQSFSKSKF